MWCYFKNKLVLMGEEIDYKVSWKLPEVTK